MPTSIFETAAAHENLKVWCGCCPNAVVFEAPGLWWRFYRKGWDDGFSAARQRFFCLKCALGGRSRVRPRKLEAVREEATRAILPNPPEREWKQQIRRYRT